ncbi:MAG TPA: DUF1592 domain-containing protein [Steroidobacteraceae bacterium]|nr:DUF1592 domain-containing protein [Steroidobacteraceae bacterium]
MKNPTLRFVAVLALAAAAGMQVDTASAQAQAGSKSWSMLGQYCTGCHNVTDWAGGVAFDTMSPQQVPQNAKIWEAAVRKLDGHLMPPPGKPQPPQPQIDRFVSWVTGDIDAAHQDPLAGHVPVQRLTREEYAHEVASLLGVQVKADDLLPPENEVSDFDNVAVALTESPSFLDQYLSAARRVAALAVGDAHPKFAINSYPVAAGSSDLNDFPPGTRGGTTFHQIFPADGEYRFSLGGDLGIGLYDQAAELRSTVVILIDRRIVFEGDVGGTDDLRLADVKGAAGRKQIMDRFTNIPVHVTAGPHEVTVALIERARAESDEYVNGFFSRGGPPQPRLTDAVTVAGPYGPTSLSETASRRLIFVCEPHSAAEEQPCAERITATLARRAYRRPVTDQDVAKLMAFYDSGRAGGGSFDAGITEMVAAVLASPDFLFRTIGPADNDHGLHRLSDLELASRLSFFLWGCGPDQELINLAAQGRLSDQKVLKAQVQRMLADPRAQTLVSDFAFKWLSLDKLYSVQPDPKLYPRFNAALRADIVEEAKLFIASVLLGNRSVLDLLDGNYTFLNQRLAEHYGIPGVFGDQFRRVQLTDPARWGLLGKAAVLMRTSYGDRTSPVLRGAWVLERLEGTPPNPPPPNVNTDVSIHPGQKPTSMRARLELHRTNPACNQCHGVIDPIGLSLENFDVTGRWRDIDPNSLQPIDASTILPGGMPAQGPVDLRKALMSHPEEFVGTFTQKLLMYADNRQTQYLDMPQVRAIVRAARKDDYRLSAIVMGIVNSDAFRLQAPPAAAPATKTASLQAPASLAGGR